MNLSEIYEKIELKKINQRKNAIFKLQKQIKTKDWSCFFPGCSEKAVQSHSQSQTHLKGIAEQGHVFMLNLSFINAIKKPNPNFEKIGINRASTFFGFCSKHDAILFKKVDSITKKNINEEALVMLTFRNFSMETRKKEYAVSLSDELFINYGELFEPQNLDHMIYSNKGRKNYLRVTKPFYFNKFKKIISTKDYSSMRHLVLLSKYNLGISCSTCINPVPMLEQPLHKPQPLISFSIISKDDYTLIILSYFETDLKLLIDFIFDYHRLEDLIFVKK